MVRPFAVPDLHVVSGTVSAALDRRAIHDLGVPQAALMERAGSGAAAVVQEVAPAGPVLVLAGKGNNGGDALVAARALRAWGRQVRLLLTAPRDGKDPLLHGWELPTLRSWELSDQALRELLAGALDGAGVVVDGVLGTGLHGAPRDEAARVVSAVPEAGAPAGKGGVIVALDIPSGVDADTGAAPGPAVKAHLTVAFGWPKLGTLLHPGRARAGRLVTLEIGFPPFPEGDDAGMVLTPAWAFARRPVRSPVTHKNAVGALAVVAGRPGMAGAAVLAGRSALRAGAGYVRLVTHMENREIVQSALPEAVFVDAGDPRAVDEALAASRAVAVGPAMGTDDMAAALLERVLRSPVPRVLDADALTLMAASPALMEAASGAPAVITPHPGEAARILGTQAPAQADPVASARALRLRTGCVVLLKGTPSVVLGPSGLHVDAVGSSDLAVAGMGDVLTGTVGAFMAQGCPDEMAAGLALVTTGRAAARAGMGPGLQSADVPEHLPGALAEGRGETDLRVPGVLLDLDPAR